MCGIAAIIDFKNENIPEADIIRMNNLSSYRGPDGEAYFFDKHIAFGHRRLAILDLNDRANQPMARQDRFTIIFNGEIYNYLELKSELRALGHNFTTASDTEVLLAAYDEWGRACVQKLNGMWAFIIYDKKNHTVFCSRDRFGIKPLYYSLINDQLFIASEIKQIMPFLRQKRANRQILLEYLLLGFSDHTDSTFFEDVKTLRGGHNLVLDIRKRTHQINRYYTLRKDDSFQKANEKEAVASIRELFESSVTLRLRSDVRVGTCLSGGLDSSSIAATAAGIYNPELADRFNAITALSEDPANDERVYAEAVSRHSNLNWITESFDFGDYDGLFIKQVEIQQEPFPDASLIMQMQVFRAAAKHGCKVMLDGQGGDEVFVGYERYYATYIKSLPFPKAIKSFFEVSRNSRLSPAQTLLFYPYFSSYHLRRAALKHRNAYIQKQYLSDFDWTSLRKASSAAQDFEKLQISELTELQLPHLLRYEDRNSMAFSIESRLPMLDYRLVEAAISIPDRYKIKGGWLKYALRKAMEDHLPPEITWRKNKIGFNPPGQSNQITPSMQAMIEDSSMVANLVTHPTNIPDKDKLKFAGLAAWEKIFNVEL